MIALFVLIELLYIAIRGFPPNNTNGVAVFEGSPIRHNRALHNVYLLEQRQQQLQLLIPFSILLWLLLPLSLDDSYSVTKRRNTGCLKKTWTFFENAITPLPMEETFPNFQWL